MDPDIVRSAGFAEGGEAAWLTLVAKALRGAEFDKSLLSHTDDAIRIDPLYRRRAGSVPLERVVSDASWALLQRLDDVDPARANAQALDDLANGATGLAIVFEGAPNAFRFCFRTAPRFMESRSCSIPLLLRSAGRRTAAHFSWRCSGGMTTGLVTKKKPGFLQAFQ